MNINNKLGLGTFPFAGPFGRVFKKASRKIIEKYLDIGGQYIDTAASYGDGSVQKNTGEALKNINRSKFGTATIGS